MPRTLLSSGTSQGGKLLPRERGFEGRGVSPQPRAAESRPALRTPTLGTPHHSSEERRRPAVGGLLGCGRPHALGLAISWALYRQPQSRKFGGKFFGRRASETRGAGCSPSQVASPLTRLRPHPAGSCLFFHFLSSENHCCLGCGPEVSNSCLKIYHPSGTDVAVPQIWGPNSGLCDSSGV